MRRRRARAPEYLYIDRDALRHLGPTVAAVRAAQQYGQQHDMTLTGVEIAAWINRDPSNVSKARKRVQRPLPPYPSKHRPGRHGFVQLNLRLAHRFGFYGALLIEQLKTWPKSRRCGRHWLIAAWELVALLGCCEKTARKHLRALAGVFLDVVWRVGQPARVRLLEAREKPLQDPPPLPNAPAAPEPPVSKEQQRKPHDPLDPRLQALVDKATAHLG